MPLSERLASSAVFLPCARVRAEEVTLDPGQRYVQRHHPSFPIAVEDNVAILKLNRATCLDIAGKHALKEALDELKAREDLRTLIIAGDHPQAFLVNVAELADMSADAARDFSASGHALVAALEALPFPAVAAVEGPALGGGCELVLGCDLAFAGRGASFGQIEAMGGVMPAFGGSWRLARRVGYPRALEMMFTGAVIDAETAKAYGLVPPFLRR
ncbi:MAG: enoyl-CoA hydratase/isomerase family protein [Bradyrhizobium sp.]|uniref:enoyl-CoA hydratase/isomerase family protein n=1 Tax=Bradyrhizobium sp. TaxID=376 RepID=UPI001D77EF41|nr:enoyl-CoA hydratase/isomerase family protein [Bradyrhizobium sp.]MBV9559759.1 enoyl-CoA hydratase/isomerase family protein [Bradyrhizobium sp.]